VKRLIVTSVCVGMLFSIACSSSGAAADPPAPEKKSKKTADSTPTDPLYSLTLMRQGSVLLEQGRFEEALDRFQQADKVAPGNATTANMIGLCQMKLGDYSGALASFSRSLELVPLYTDARNNRGAVYMAMGQLHLSEVDFVAVLGDSTYPRRKQVFYNLGLVYLQQGQLGAAEENFRRAILLPNPVFEAYLRLAELAQRQGELAQAKSLLEEATLNFPESTEVKLELGKVLVLMGRSKEARPYLEQVIADAPDSDFALTAKGLLELS
jgi:tetratricopeptide (TPR) repeat protein